MRDWVEYKLDAQNICCLGNLVHEVAKGIQTGGRGRASVVDKAAVNGGGVDRARRSSQWRSS